MIFTVYVTVNKMNGKFYFGVHKTTNPEDTYLGSGTYIERAIRKYGKDAFYKVVLFEFPNQNEAWIKEDHLISLWRSHPHCMNLRKGGSGGFDYINDSGISGYKLGLKIIQDLGKQPDFKEKQRIWGSLGDHQSTRVREYYLSQQASENRLRASKLGAERWKDHNHSLAAKRRIADKSRGSNNSQFGSFWITNGSDNKKCRGEVPQGWRKGRDT